MITHTAGEWFAGTYNDGQPYRLARGRFAPRERVEDLLAASHAVVNLAGERSTGAEFLRRIVREMRIRFYQPKSVKSYRQALRGLLRWHGGRPDRITREDVREYLLYLVEGGAGSSWVSINLSAIRTAFDKMCRRSVTLGLQSPRKPKRLPVVLSEQEVRRLLEATPSLRDKLLLGLMYATGMRVGEVVRVRSRDLDFDRRVINVWQGKGRSDRQVTLPETFAPLLRGMAGQLDKDGFLFPGERRGRHISVRTAERIMERAVRVAGIRKRATPHSLRHSFAVHSFEHGCDIRRIQVLLGHMRLETTTIYVRVATRDQSAASPLDVLNGTVPGNRAARPVRSRPVGKLKLHFREELSSSPQQRIVKVTIGIDENPRTVFLTGIVARQVRRGWVTLEIPPLEVWEEPLRWLDREKRWRIEQPEFFEMLQSEIAERLLGPPLPA